jgi:hypothetical protein
MSFGITLGSRCLLTRRFTATTSGGLTAAVVAGERRR